MVPSGTLRVITNRRRVTDICHLSSVSSKVRRARSIGRDRSTAIRGCVSKLQARNGDDKGFFLGTL